MGHGGTTSRVNERRVSKTAQTITGPCNCGGELGKIANPGKQYIKKEWDTIRLGYVYKHKNLLKTRLANAYAKQSVQRNSKIANKIIAAQGSLLK